jgi:hypothetical protein
MGGVVLRELRAHQATAGAVAPRPTHWSGSSGTGSRIRHESASLRYRTVSYLKEGRMSIVAYLEGTDPLLLTRLAAQGVGTIPVSNGFDDHGKYVNHLTSQDNVSVVVGYLHKVLPTSVITLTARDILFACETQTIPVLIIAEASDHEKARKLLGEAADHVRLVDPDRLYEAILETIG